MQVSAAGQSHAEQQCVCCREVSAQVEFDMGTRWDAASEVLDQWGFGAPEWEGGSFPHLHLSVSAQLSVWCVGQLPQSPVRGV